MPEHQDRHGRTPIRRRSTAMLLVVPLAALALVVSGGCTGDADEPTSAGSDRATTVPVGEADAGSDPAPAVETFRGSLEDFYVPPDPMPTGEPGDLIRIQELDRSEGRVTSRIMYLSNDASGADRAVTGVVTYPEAESPADGWTVISSAHGTTGVAGSCAPSRSGEAAPTWAVEGVHVATDYVGMGPVGEVHPYLSKPSEGNAVIDAVTAARQIPAANAGTRWVSIGHSQGGHGALSAHELAAERAPELELIGTVALAPAAMLEKVYGGIDPIVTSILTMMALYSGASEHPEIEPADYLTPAAMSATGIFETGCLDAITDALVPVAMGGAFTADPRTTEPAASLLKENDVGEVAVDGVPVLLASGTADDRVVIERVRDLFARMCGAGQVTEFHVVDGADHGSVLPQTADLVASWIQARIDGEPSTDTCAGDAVG